MTKCLFRTSLVWLLATGCSITVLLLPAIWNGFPLVFADTGGYLERPFQGDLGIGRSALYGAFLAAGIPLQFWPNVVIQAGVTLWILRLVLRIHRAGDRPSVFIAVIIGLCLLTSLPWYVSQLMPDIFLPLAVLAAYILAFAPGELTRTERTALVLFIGIAIAFHMSILALVVALLVLIALLNRFGHWLRLPTPAIGLPSAGLIAGLMLAPISNLVITGSLGFTPGGTTFVFARLVQDGIVRQYLADHCPDDHLRLCAYRKQLPTSADDWLWSYSSPLHKLGWWRAFEPEANRIIRESLAYYPDRHLKTALVATVQQFVYFKTGEGMGSNDNWHAESVFAIVAPRVLDAFRASRQQHDEFDFTLVNMVQIPIAWLSIMTLILVLLGERRPERSAAGLAIVCLIALVANAAICGTFSNPNDRYQSRLVWLAAFATWVVLFNRRTTVKLKHDQVTG